MLDEGQRPLRPSRARPLNTSSIRPEPPAVRLTSPVSRHLVEPFHVPVQSLVPVHRSTSPVAGSTLTMCATHAPTGFVHLPLRFARWSRWLADAAGPASATTVRQASARARLGVVSSLRCSVPPLCDLLRWSGSGLAYRPDEPRSSATMDLAGGGGTPRGRRHEIPGALGA